MCQLFLFKGGGFRMFLVIGQSKWPIEKKNRNFKTFVFWDAIQPN
jgi:hypothetical protein